MGYSRLGCWRTHHLQVPAQLNVPDLSRVQLLNKVAVQLDRTWQAFSHVVETCTAAGTATGDLQLIRVAGAFP